MAPNKTARTQQNVCEFLDSLPTQRRRDEGYQLLELMHSVTGEQPYMYGPSIVGFGSYHYRYASGHEGDAPLIGFSPRKSSIVLYLASDFPEKNTLLSKLGKHKTSVACLYINKLNDIDPVVLRQLVSASFEHSRSTDPNC